MAFTAKYLPVARERYFSYYADGQNDSMEENFTPSFAYELHTVQVHLSVGHASVVDLIARLSCVEDSAHNVILFSKAMNNSTDYIWEASAVPYVFQSGDHINLSMTLSSTNRWGVTVTGWAITQDSSS